MSEASSRRITELATDTMRKIDAEYVASMQSLSSLLSQDLATARDRIDEALQSYAQGRKEEAALRTRKAWEACVNFALTKLPKKPQLDSLSKKSRYVLDSLEQQDQSSLIVEQALFFSQISLPNDLP